ncbi:substrate-binding domain-containing protein [Nitrosomonas sp.]|uniref:substrate-binding domain-containing protein n=1 Tax=Nitrosomonas sp. TaxID=42353 RepID=UPI0025E00B92|nr:substrate-binding domain-containing protein [Nitrosomonas sp.]
MPGKSFIRIMVLLTFIVQAAQASAQAARDYISIVGSSTVYPFTTVVAETFGKTTRFKTPKIESTGSGGGFKLFCGGIGVTHPDMTDSSRAIKKSEINQCKANGVTEIIEVKIGYDALQSLTSKKMRHWHCPGKIFFWRWPRTFPILVVASG